MSYTLIDQNDDFVVINKWPGTQVQSPQHLSASGDDSEGLLRCVASDLGLPKLYPVHRLDEATSGLLLMAKTPAANSALSQAFARREVSKYYLAISDHKPRKKQGALIGDMQKVRAGNWRLMTSRKNPAVTQFLSCSLQPGLRLFLLKPHSGKTHQLRVALKALGAPILGDGRYGGSSSDRMYLHAWQLFVPWQGAMKRYEALPESGEWFEAGLLKPCLLPWQNPEQLAWPKLALPSE